MSNLINISTILIKRGNTAAASAYVGPLGELLVDTGLQTLRLQDGSTPGGMSTLVNSQQLSNVIVAIEGIQSNTANISALVANIHGANISGLTSNVAILQQELSANGIARIGGLLVGNIGFTSNSYIWSVEDGQIQFSANGYNDQTGIFLNNQNLAVLYANTELQLVAGSTSSGETWVFDQYGNLTLPGNVIFADSTVQSTAWNGRVSSLVNGSQTLQLAANGTVTMPDGVTYNNATLKSQPGQALTLENSTGTQTVSVNDVFSVITANSHSWAFNSDAGLIFPDHTYQYSAYQGPAGQTSFASNAYVTTQINNLINSAPGTLDTLGQIAANLATEAGAIGGIISSITSVNANVTAANAKIATLQTQVYANANASAYLTTYLPTYTGNITAGNLVVSGNINYVGNVNSITIATGTFQGNAAGFGALYAGILSGYTYQAQTVLQNSTNFNGYAQVNHQNINSGSSASTDYVATADTGTAGAGYIDMGINSSGFVNGTGNELNYPLDGYLYAQGTTGTNGNLILGTGGTADIVFTTGGFSTTNNYQGRFKNNVGLILAQSTQSTSTASGALQVAGGVGIAGNTYIGGNLIVNGSNVIASINSINANVTAANATILTLSTSLTANTAGLYNSILGANSTISTLQSNVGAYETWANANVSGLYNSILGANSSIATVTANIGSFYTYANLNYGTSSYANANVVGYLAGNVTIGNASATSFRSNNFLYSNGVSILTGIGGTYSNTNVVAYLAGNISTGNVGVASGSWVDFRNTDTNWRMGYGINAYSKTTAITSLDVVVGQGSGGPDGFTVGQTGGVSIFELVGYTKNAWFANNITAVGNVTSGNVLATGFFYANGTPFTSSSYGNTQVAAYLVANPQAGTYSNTNVAAYLTTQTFYSNSNVAAYLVANPQCGTYSNTNVSAYLTSATINTTGNITAGNLTTSGTYTVANITTTGAYGNITGANVISANSLQVSNGIFWANGTAWSSTSGGTTYSNANVVANLANFVTNISTTANITTTANIISPNYLFANGVNILSTVTGGSGTYSNTNVAAYLTANPISSIANGSSSVTIASSGGNCVVQIGGVSTAIFSQSQLNVTGNIIASANIQAANIIATQYGNSVGTTASYSGNVTAAYFTGNGVGLTGITYNQIGNIYGSSSNVTLQAGSYSWTFDNTGNLSIPTNGNIIWANGAVFSSGTGGGGTTYSNANVVAMLAANTAVFVGNTGVIGNVATGNIQANATAIFLGANTVISNYGSPTFGYSTHIGNNIYFDVNGVQRYRNTQTGAADLIVAPGTLNFYATGTAVTANTATGYTGATSLYMALSTSGMSLYNNAGLVSSGPVTIQSASGLVTNQATIAVFNGVGSTINMGGVATTITLGQSTPGTSSNVFVGNTVGTQTGNLTLRARGQYNYLTAFGTAGGYNSPPYNNQTLTGGSGTGMIASYTTAGNGYVTFPITIVNPGTGYKNGDVVTLPGGLGSTAQIWNYNSNYVAQTGQSDLTLTIDGNLILPGGLSLPANSVVTGDFSNSTFNYRTVFRTTTANATTGIYAVPSGTGTGAAWQAANSSNIANTSKIMITTNGSTDVQLVSGINGTGTYLPLSFLTNGSTQMQLGTAGNLLMVTGGNISTTGNVIAGNIIANQYGNSIGTTATYSGNVTASSVIASGSSGPQTRFLWDTWQTNSNVGLAAFTPSGTVGGNATWDSNQAYGLKLTTNTTSQSGYINWNSNTVNYNYDMVITASVGAGEGTGADGQWIYFGANAAVSGNPGNTNSMGGIAVMNHFYSSASQFEVYVNGTQTNIPYIGNTYTPSGITVWNGAYFNFYNLTLKIRKIQNGNRMLEIYLNEAYQGSVNIGSWTPAGNNFGVAAYTGGSTAYQWVRQLRIDW